MREMTANKPFLTALRLQGLRGRVLAAPISYVGTALLLVFAYFTRPALLSPLLLLLIIRQAAALGIAVRGQSLCVRVLSLDLSIGGVILAVRYILTSGIIRLPDAELILVCIIFGAAVGLINAFL